MLMLAAIVVIAAGLLPACGSICCAGDAETVIHRPMPCCETQPRLERSEAVRMPQATSVSIPAHVAAPVTTVETPASRALALAPLPERHEPSPPLFLRNAQLLI
jgi:hypothetical protein